MKPNNLTLADMKSRCIINADTGCWEWALSRNKDGYGKVSINMKDWRTHRLAFVLAGNELAREDLVLHKCDNPPCCNPEHLFLGTNQENVADRLKKGRSAKGDNNGARLYPERIARGERQGLAVMTSEKVKALRAAYDSGYSTRRLSAEFGISRPTVHQIVSRKTWRHV